MTARRPLRNLVLLAVVALAGVGGVAGVAGRAWWRLGQPFQGFAGEETTVVVAPGTAATAILEQLAAAGVIPDALTARLYLVYVLDNPRLAAGEYRFHGPSSPRQAIAKLVRGEVVTYRVTVIEGQSLDETAAALAAAGFGSPRAFLAAMRDPAPIADLDPDAGDLEGYLFPETYSFAHGTPEREIVLTLVRTFRARWTARIAPRLGEAPGRTVRQIVTLASIVEKEARRAEERPVIAGVYANRLARGIALYADPTVIFARKRLGHWDGNLVRRDLELDSPYNTYRYPGLPPGPICSPGEASLAAAAAPATVPYLYFVSRNDGSHVFSSTLAEHNRNVEEWQRRYWRRRWAAERR